jgi:hypothetical protein
MSFREILNKFFISLPPDFDFPAIFLINFVAATVIFAFARFVVDFFRPELSSKENTKIVAISLSSLLFVYVLYMQIFVFVDPGRKEYKVPGTLRPLYETAERGDPASQYQAGQEIRSMIVEFDGNEQYVRALKWYIRSAKQGYPKAFPAVAWCYETGKCGQKDLMKAYFWYSLAATRMKDQSSLDKRDQLAKNLSATQINSVNKLVSEWKPIAEKASSEPPYWGSRPE